MSDNFKFPWEDIEAALRDRSLQAEHPVEQVREDLLSDARPCPKCGRGPESLTWFYFSSPPDTWELLCGRAGWMTICDPCQEEVDFFLEMMN